MAAALLTALRDAVRGRLRRAAGPGAAPPRWTPATGGRPAAPVPGRSDGATYPPFPGGYPGDFLGRPAIRYAPHPDDRADPGEVVWAWVPYEEDHRIGKDRPVLVIGLDGGWLLASPLTSEDHDRDAAQEASRGRFWMDIGAGDWDARRRPSEVRLDRIVRVDPAHVRRTGGRLDEPLFLAVGRAILARRGVR
ncbi:MAG TPA: type II toxin-antitoxin system PemK/MazF family toxin [Propionibacteriaceae bacterium]|nr:type II toxin-antitoxin system PemK/MazF family toxin [Propionibacteriaceae bacterium]